MNDIKPMNLMTDKMNKLCEPHNSKKLVQDVEIEIWIAIIC